MTESLRSVVGAPTTDFLWARYALLRQNKSCRTAEQA